MDTFDVEKVVPHLENLQIDSVWGTKIRFGADSEGVKRMMRSPFPVSVIKDGVPQNLGLSFYALEID